MSESVARSLSSDLADRYRALPRSMKWLLWAAAVIVLYFAVVEQALDAYNALNARADVAQQALAAYGEPDPNDELAVKEGRKLWGEVAPPTQGPERVLAAKNRILELLGEHGVTGDVSITERAPSAVRISDANATGGAAEGVQYQRGPIEVKFTAPPHVVAAVVAGVERDPLVAMIESLRLRRRNDRAELEVTLVAEAWFVKPSGV